jgi:hypothetical protein
MWEGYAGNGKKSDFSQMVLTFLPGVNILFFKGERMMFHRSENPYCTGRRSTKDVPVRGRYRNGERRNAPGKTTL